MNTSELAKAMINEPRGGNQRGLESEAIRTHKYTPLPVDALPIPLAEFVRAHVQAMDCDASFLALPLLSALAAAIGNTHVALLKRGWTEPAIIWGAIIGRSGTLKTQARKAVLRSVRAREQALDAEHGRAMEAYKLEHARWKDADKRTRGAEPEAPAHKRLTVSDITIEALGLRLAQSPRGLLSSNDELAALFGGMNAYKARGVGADEAHWLSIFNAETLRIDRKGDGGSCLIVPIANVSISGGIQPDTLRACLTARFIANGMASRWLFAMPPWKRKRWTDAEVDPAVDEELARIFDALYALPLILNQHGAPEPTPLGFSVDARDRLIAFLNEHNALARELDDAECAAWSKLEGYCPRIALVLHLAEWAAKGGGGNPGAIGTATVDAAIRLTRWFSAEALRVYALLSEDEASRELRTLVEWVRRRGGRAKVGELARSGPRQYRGDFAAAGVALQALVDTAGGRWEFPKPGVSGGGPERVFILNVDTGTTDSAVENDGSSIQQT